MWWRKKSDFLTVPSGVYIHGMLGLGILSFICRTVIYILFFPLDPQLYLAIMGTFWDTETIIKILTSLRERQADVVQLQKKPTPWADVLHKFWVCCMASDLRSDQEIFDIFFFYPSCRMS
jgi:uncharacterized membrane protein